jgi:predicted ribosomally synthesized peptide with nif11-like leader
MAIEQVKAFYNRLAADPTFYTQLESTANKAECQQVVRLAGYHFTETEFEDYTAQLLNTEKEIDRLESLDKKRISRSSEWCRCVYPKLCSATSLWSLAISISLIQKYLVIHHYHVQHGLAR